MEISLPDKFIERIKEDLGDEADSFLGSYHDTPKRGLRINPLKTDCDTEKRSAEGLDRIPWESHGYYYAAAKTLTAPGKSPLHAAGAYYIQEPSAMAPVSFLDVRPGMCVLDLCAAP
ncbi:MAG: RNA methyltransferase, partial [Lachnospiraceae bacterium]|nr:RNA methyltransferase [Lachnospiraceae bacterium]